MDFAENLILLALVLKDCDVHVHARIDDHQHQLNFEWMLEVLYEK